MNQPVSQIRCGNRIIQKKQDNSSLQKHYQSLRNARPMTGNTTDKNSVTINNKKRQMVMQNRFTEIQRQNRILFQKITTIMHKGQSSQTITSTQRPTSVMNKTLNGVYRKRQLQSIEYENAKMLKRIKQKKSSYGVQQLHREWMKKKKVIKNMSLYPYILNDKFTNDEKHSKGMQLNLTRDSQFPAGKSNELQRFMEIRRVRKIDGYMFLVTIKYQGNKLFIIGDIREHKSIKIIELQKSEAEEFIAQECNGNIDNIFGMLRFDHKSGDLFLVGKDSGGGDIELKQSEIDLKRKAMSQHQTRQKRLLTTGVRNLPPRPFSKEFSRRTKINSSYRENNQQDFQPSSFSFQSIKNNININNLKKSQNNFIRNSFTEGYHQSNKGTAESKKQKQQVGMEIPQKNEKVSQWVRILTTEKENTQICNQKENNPIIDHEQQIEHKENHTDHSNVNQTTQNEVINQQPEPLEDQNNIEGQQIFEDV